VDIQVLNKVPGLDHKHNLQTTKLDLTEADFRVSSPGQRLDPA
jgi:hypothetical protein